MSAAASRRVCFGSSQERRLLPLHYAPDRLGNEMSRQETASVGPGCYDNHEHGTIIYNLQKTPGSNKGYSLSARTAARFPPCSQTVTPSPQHYQQDQSGSRLPAASKTPFNSNTQRFTTTMCPAQENPGPGTYSHVTDTNRKVNWPMRFSSPDWSRLPQLKRRSLRVKLDDEKEFQKQSSRLAYLKLYY